MEALRSCLSRTSVIWPMLVSSIISVSVFKPLSCFSGSADDGGFTGGSVPGKSSSWSSASAGNADVWRLRACRDALSTAWFPAEELCDDLPICATMSAHSCMQNFLEYMAAERDRRR